TSLNILSVPRTKNYSLTLSDGTKIEMNSKTILRFPFQFKRKTREVYLEGEAYFKVAKDKDHPFIVHARGSEIRVLGTVFNLNTYDSSFTKTSLVEGSVVASNAMTKVQLKAGFEASTSKAGGKISVEKFDETEVLSWRKGRFNFRNASLHDLSSLLMRWYKVKVVFENPSGSKKTFSGEIWKNQPVELFLDNLKLSNNIPLQYSNGVVTFR
ncbi:MAG: FecR domain-containing protein, partial [Chitinophagaceae bacterium]